MCLGLATACRNSAGFGVSATIKNNQPGICPGFFAHTAFSTLVTDNAASTAAWTDKKVATAADDAAVKAQLCSAIAITGLTTMKGVTTYGAITVPAAAHYDGADLTSNTGGGFTTTDAPIATTWATLLATFMMPVEADTYADVPRLSPLDADGW